MDEPEAQPGLRDQVSRIQDDAAAEPGDDSVSEQVFGPNAEHSSVVDRSLPATIAFAGTEGDGRADDPRRTGPQGELTSP